MTRILFLVLCIQASLAVADCGNTSTTPRFEVPYSEGWGIDLRNTRYQAQSVLNSKNASKLQLKWAYGLSNDAPRSYPFVTEDTIFIGDTGRGVVALDRENGCERWVFQHDGYISSAILHAKIDSQHVLIFNDRTEGVFALDGVTGKLLWRSEVTSEPLPWYSGTPLIANNRVYVPISSQEVFLAMNPLYGCCTTSGGMAAFDLATGRELWYRPTIEEPARQTGEHWFFVQKYGPSGAAVWGAPAYDRDQDRLFFGTGQNYSHPTTTTSDALHAVRGESGVPIWQRQFTQNDAYTAACNLMALNHPNCPKPTGPDLDFGAPTMLVKTAGAQILIAGQKSAEIHALNPATGERIWTRRIGSGGIIGGVHWGLAASEQLGLVFAPISDKAILDFPAPGTPAPGLYALDVATGTQRWHFSRPSRCDTTACEYGLSAAALATNDVVVTGSMDGYVEIYDASNGQRVWHFDAWKEFETVNDTPATGGAFDAHGPMVADDLLMITSGYSYVGAQRAGNTFLVFQLPNDRE